MKSQRNQFLAHVAGVGTCGTGQHPMANLLHPQDRCSGTLTMDTIAYFILPAGEQHQLNKWSIGIHMVVFRTVHMLLLFGIAH
eukprot:1725124-Amphidinium_carterae.1